jgi:hypothetical protein
MLGKQLLDEDVDPVEARAGDGGHGRSWDG